MGGVRDQQQVAQALSCRGIDLIEGHPLREEYVQSQHDAIDALARWMREEWDEPGDNIFLWDFRRLETAGGSYLLREHAKSEANSHPNAEFAARVAPLLGRRIAAVLEGRGDGTSLTGD